MKIVTLEHIKDKIIKAINKQFGVTVYAFAKSDTLKKWGINGSNLSSYLSKGSISFPVLKKLYEKLNLGTLEKHIEVQKTVLYFVE